MFLLVSCCLAAGSGGQAVSYGAFSGKAPKHPALQALSNSEPIPDVGANPVSLRQWRISSERAEAAVLDSFAGVAYPVRIRYPSPSDADGGAARADGRVDFCANPVRRVLTPVIPPYVGMKARRVVLDVLPVAADGVEIALRASQAPLYVGVASFSTALDVSPEALAAGATGRWRTVSLDTPVTPGNRLAEVSLAFSGAGAAELYVADPRVECEDGTAYDLLNERFPSLLEGIPGGEEAAAAARPPRRAHSPRPLVKAGMGTVGVIRYAADLPAFGEWFARYFPEYDVEISGGTSLEPAIRDVVAALPDNVRFGYQWGQHGLRYPALYDALPRDEFGRRQDFKFNSIVATHPIIQRGYDDRMLYAASLGVFDFQCFDYVWPTLFAQWGYGKDSVAAFRRDLAGEDEGLALAARRIHGPGPDRVEPERTIHFADYYEAYYGIRPRPEDFGLSESGWAAFEPPTSAQIAGRGEVGQRQGDLFFMLRSYEWLLQAQRWNARAASLGGTFSYLLNGATPQNANDHLFLLRLKDTDAVLPEFFSGTPKSVDRIYRDSGICLREARRVGKRFGITMETSRGGGGCQPYWSPRTAFAVAYFLSALGFDTLEYDAIGHASFWSEFRDAPPDSMLRRYGEMTTRHFLGAARGYRRAKCDAAAKAGRGDAFVLSRRNTGRAVRDSANWLSALSEIGADCEKTDIVELPDILPSARVVFAGDEIARPGVREALEAWQAGDPDRRLVAGAPPAGEALRGLAGELGLDFVQLDAEKSGAIAARFRTRCGESAVLFDRSAVEGADRDAWHTNVWYKTVYKQVFSPDDYLYFDKVPGGRCVADVPVAQDGPYRVYRYIADEEDVVDAAGGALRLDASGDFCEVFHYAPDTPDFRAFVAELRADRALTGDAFSDDDAPRHPPCPPPGGTRK